MLMRGRFYAPNFIMASCWSRMLALAHDASVYNEAHAFLISTTFPVITALISYIVLFSLQMMFLEMYHIQGILI